MPLLISHSQALKLAAALRKTEPGLVQVGIKHGALYVQAKPDGGDWTDVFRDAPPKLADDHSSS
jgi:hypothetical protein